jgi:hypothetical protein
MIIYYLNSYYNVWIIRKLIKITMYEHFIIIYIKRITKHLVCSYSFLSYNNAVIQNLIFGIFKYT